MGQPVLKGSIENKELTMNTILLLVIGIAALSVLLAVMIYLLAVSREMELPDGDEV
jgi:Zn-dependent protease with chaperone function